MSKLCGIATPRAFPVLKNTIELSTHFLYNSDMKTIAITIDEATLKLLDELASATRTRRSRSALVRAALREFAERERRKETEAKEHEILHKHRKRLARQTRLLVAEQARL
jgi:metal-responsive CopG/Arc/MetJ family transcriptional regulator